MVDAIIVGSGLACGRVCRERNEQVAGAVGSQGIGECLLVGGVEGQVDGINDGGIVEGPLENIVGDEPGRAHRGLAGSGNRLVAVGQQEGGLRIAKGHPAIDDREDGAVRVVDLHDEFGAIDAGHGCAGNDTDVARLVAMKKGKYAAREIEARLGIAGVRREHFDLRELAEGDDAILRPDERDGAVGSGAELIVGTQFVGERGGNPVGVAGAGKSDCAFQFDDADASISRLGGRFGDCQREKTEDRNQQIIRDSLQAQNSSQRSFGLVLGHIKWADVKQHHCLGVGGKNGGVN